jgi:carbon monoxide dehydrogenase subunit G
MSQVHVSTDIDAPIQDVWDVIMDPDRLADWVTIHRSVHDISDRPLREGSTMGQSLRLHGVTFRVNWHLVGVSEPRQANWEGQGPAHARASIGYRLSGGDGEPTHFEYSNDFTAPGGRLGNVASRVLVRGASEREAQNSLTRLKKLLENGR